MQTEYKHKVFRYRSTRYDYYESQNVIELFVTPIKPVFINIERHYPGSLKRKLMKAEIDKEIIPYVLGDTNG
jgi:hypothetical protein